MSDFRRAPTFDPRRLRAEPLQDSSAVRNFACGDASLDKFITTEEALAFEQAGLGRTYLVFHEAILVAFYTLSNDSLRIEYLDAAKPLARAVERRR